MIRYCQALAGKNKKTKGVLLMADFCHAKIRNSEHPNTLQKYWPLCLGFRLRWKAVRPCSPQVIITNVLRKIKIQWQIYLRVEFYLPIWWLALNLNVVTIWRVRRGTSLYHGHCQALFTHFTERYDHKICEHAALCAVTRARVCVWVWK